MAKKKPTKKKSSGRTTPPKSRERTIQSSALRFNPPLVRLPQINAVMPVFSGFTIDGTNASGDAVGIHIAGGYVPIHDVEIRNFKSGAGMKVSGGHVLHDDVEIVDCETGIDQSGGIVDSNNLVIRKTTRPESD